MVRLTTESALWPKPRRRISSTSSTAAEATLLNARTIQLSANKTTVTTVRTPKRSMAGPQSKLKDAPSRVGPEVHLAKTDALEIEVLQQGFGDEADADTSGGQGRNHGDSRKDHIDPAVIKRNSGNEGLRLQRLLECFAQLDANLWERVIRLISKVMSLLTQFGTELCCHLML